MVLLTLPFWVFTTASKTIATLGTVGLPLVTGTILYLTARGIATTLKSIYRVLHTDEDVK